MNKLLILLLLSTPLFAQDDLIVIEDKVLEGKDYEVLFMSDGNYARQDKKNNPEVFKGVWERKGNYITIFTEFPLLTCTWSVRKIATTYIFGAGADGLAAVCDQVNRLMQETEGSESHLSSMLDEYKMVD